ncbi:MAG: DNA polymerase/3'-5' exonuclease PolX, partial [Candidatus Omnitrophica bacterium]|nr:DNA polymerase/3'-5' exonuclease PolX [Candidatus Omnitrophota bacterium]
MVKPAKKEIIAVLEEMAVFLELLGANPFKVRAFANGARVLEGMGGDIAPYIEEGGLSQIKGIGPGLIRVITELWETGASSDYEELRSEVPEGLLEMLRIQGLGPKRVKAIHEKLGVDTLAELEYACNENRLSALEGFGAKTQANVLKGIDQLKRYRNQHLYSSAIQEAEAFLEELQLLKGVKRASIAGSLRRRKEVIKDIDLLAAAADSKPVMEWFVKHPSVVDLIAHGETKSSVRLKSGIQCDLRVVSDKEFPYALHHFTGSKEHNVAMRGRAQGLGYKMNEYGLFQGGKLVSCKSEEEIFAKLGMDWLPPELREDRGEITAAEQKRLPRILDWEDLRGAFHVHTDASDGAAPLKKMTDSARKLGWAYVGISDHSQTANYAHGLDPKRVKEQQAEIDALNQRYKGAFRVFKGIESDILPDGSLDYSDKVLASFDFVIGSIHSNFKMTARQQTARLVKAMKNKHLTMLGHLTGRLLLGRDGYEFDLEEILRVAADLGVAIEINANPHRLDLDWRNCRRAKDLG